MKKIILTTITLASLCSCTTIKDAFNFNQEKKRAPVEFAEDALQPRSYTTAGTAVASNALESTSKGPVYVLPVFERVKVAAQSSRDGRVVREAGFVTIKVEEGHWGTEAEAKALGHPYVDSDGNYLFSIGGTDKVRFQNQDEAYRYVSKNEQSEILLIKKINSLEEELLNKKAELDKIPKELRESIIKALEDKQDQESVIEMIKDSIKADDKG